MALIGRKTDTRETITHGILTLIPDRGASPVCKRSWRVEQSGVFMGSVERVGKRRWIEHSAGTFGSRETHACAWATRVLDERLEAVPKAPRVDRARDARERREQLAREAFNEAEEKREARSVSLIGKPKESSLSLFDRPAPAPAPKASARSTFRAFMAAAPPQHRFDPMPGSDRCFRCTLPRDQHPHAARKPSTPTTSKMKIVLAWTTEGHELEREGRIDIGERHTFRTIRVPKAVMWKNRGDEKDLAKAKAYVAQHGTPDEPHYVFTYPTSERHPLERAREDVLKR